jgi:hypothetical protein
MRPDRQERIVGPITTAITAGGAMDTTNLRHLRGRDVRIRSDRGELLGTLLSVTGRSLWMLVAGEDVIIERSRVGAVLIDG